MFFIRPFDDGQYRWAERYRQDAGKSLAVGAKFLDPAPGSASDISYTPDDLGYTFGIGYDGRFSFLKVPDSTIYSESAKYYRGCYTITTHVGQLKNQLYLVPPPDPLEPSKGKGPKRLGMPLSQQLLCSELSGDGNPSKVPDANKRFYIFTDDEYATNGVFYIKSRVAASGTSSTPAFLIGLFENPDGGIVDGDIFSANPVVKGSFKLGLEDAGPVIPSTDVMTTATSECQKSHEHGLSFLPTKRTFTYYITCPHATLNATNPAIIDYKQLQYSATTPNVIATTGYDYNTQGWVFEDVTPPTDPPRTLKEYTIRTARNGPDGAGNLTVARYLTYVASNTSNTTFIIEPHPAQFGAVSIRSTVTGPGSLMTYLSFSPAGTMSWVKATSNGGANLAFFFRPGETSYPPATAPLTVHEPSNSKL